MQPIFSLSTRQLKMPQSPTCAGVPGVAGAGLQEQGPPPAEGRSHGAVVPHAVFQLLPVTEKKKKKKS